MFILENITNKHAFWGKILQIIHHSAFIQEIFTSISFVENITNKLVYNGKLLQFTRRFIIILENIYNERINICIC